MGKDIRFPAGFPPGHRFVNGHQAGSRFLGLHPRKFCRGSRLSGQLLCNPERIQPPDTRLPRPADITADIQYTVPRLQHIGAFVPGDAGIVKGGKVRRVQSEFQRFRLSGRKQFRLSERRQIPQRLAQLPLRRGGIDLHDLPSREGSGICDRRAENAFTVL